MARLRQIQGRPWRLIQCVLIAVALTACGGDSGDSAGEDGLLPTLSVDTNPGGERIDVSSKNYFPLGQGDTWSYEKIQDGVPVGTISRMVNGPPAPDGAIAVIETESPSGGAPESTSEQLRKTGEGVWIADPFDAKDEWPGLYEALPWLLEYPTPFYAAGGVRNILRQGNLEADVDGDGKMDYYRAEVTQVFRGFETLTVLGRTLEVAHFSNELKFATTTTSGTGSFTIVAKEEAYFAPDIGLVRSDRAAADASGKAVFPAHRLVLFSATIAGQAYPFGLAWQPIASGTTKPLRALAASATHVAAVGGDGTVVTSTDGVVWTARSAGTTANLYGLASSGSAFVAVGETGAIVTSTDLVTWTPRSSGTSNALNAVAWTGSQFLVVGKSGTVLTSPDGIAWTSQASGTAQDLYGVGGHSALAIATGDGGTILSSTDAVHWTTRPSKNGGRLGVVVWSGTQFLVVGTDNANYPDTTLQTSFDGMTWTRQSAAWGNGQNGAAWSGKHFLTVGAFGTGNVSFDGVAWRSAAYSYFTAEMLNAATWFKGRFIAAGANGVMFSALEALPVDATLFDIEASGAQLVAVGALGTVKTSVDGVAWTQTASGVTVHLHGVSTTGPRRVAVGDLGTILSSDDLAVWVVRASGTPARLRAVTWNGLRYVAVGDGGVILTSPDAVTWSIVASGTSADLYGVSGHSSLLVVVGDERTLLTSPDGSTWTPQVSSGGTLLHDVVWSGSQFLAVGNNPNGLTPTLQTSSDGILWTPRTGAVGNEMFGAAWSGMQFATVGSSGTAQTSPDGVQWTGASLSLWGDDHYGVAWHLDRFLAVGKFGHVDTLR